MLNVDYIHIVRAEKDLESLQIPLRYKWVLWKFAVAAGDSDRKAFIVTSWVNEQEGALGSL